MKSTYLSARARLWENFYAQAMNRIVASEAILPVQQYCQRHHIRYLRNKNSLVRRWYDMAIAASFHVTFETSQYFELIDFVWSLIFVFSS